MCGIAGIVGSPESADTLQELASRAILGLKHRGPDDYGMTTPSPGVMLCQTRLAILDLSPLGHQPMISDDGRFQIVFNGEIYNFRELRTRLESEGCRFRTGSDTEVLLQLYLRRGGECVNLLEGMFAFAVWDTREQTLFLARDPLGIKPLYVWTVNGCLAFASELNPLLSLRIGSIEIDSEAVVGFLRFGSVQEPQTLIRNVAMLPAGSSLLWSQGSFTRKTHWQLQFGDMDCPPEEAAKIARTALEESINRHFVSDVPVGIFLSGGLDSTAMLALAKHLGHQDIRTFCISFDQASISEGRLAQRTAEHFGTHHTDWRMTSADGQSLISGYLDAMDQPSNDGFNTYCVAKLAHDHGMKVVLSGVGGDELLSGYPSFQKIPKLQKIHQVARCIPGLRSLSHKVFGRTANPKLARLAEFLTTPGDVPDAWAAMRGFFTDREARILATQWLGLRVDQDPTLSDADGRDAIMRQPTPADQISACETLGYMKNQLLRDSDVMSMRWGLELRVPFVDRALIDRVGQLSAKHRLRPGKQLLLEAVPEIPDWIRNQPKRGFRFPFEEWVRNQWADTFAEVASSSPVLPVSWYRTWCLFVLKHFIERIRGMAGHSN